jgi:hypothetical protein
MRKAAYAAVLVSAVAVAVPWAVTAQTPPEDQALDRIEKKYGVFGWGCIDFCEGPKFQVETPPDVTAVDVVVTATISYRLGTGHHGFAILGRVTDGLVSPPNTEPLQGGKWGLPSTDGRTATTTMTWSVRNLPAEGKTHHFILDFVGGSPLAGDFVAETRKAVVVAEVWSAGR